jgi:hypothetical protein
MNSKKITGRGGGAGAGDHSLGKAMAAAASKTLHQPAVYQFAPGTLIEVTIKKEIKFQGNVVVNPEDTRDGRLEIMNVKDQAGRMYSDMKLFKSSEIEFVKVLQTSPIKERVREFNMSTFFADNVERLDAYLKALLVNEVKEIGVAFHGVGCGRYGKAAWIMLCTENCIAAVDVAEFDAKNVSVWKLLKSPIFENKKIVKVLHDLRPVADQLFHRHNVLIKNVYDTQLVDNILNQHNKSLVKPRKMIPLYAALRKYLDHLAVNSDITWLKWYFNRPKLSSRMKNPLLERPMPHSHYTKYMALSVKYLLLLKQEMESIKIKNFRRIMNIYSTQIRSSKPSNLSVEEQEQAQAANLDKIIDCCYKGLKLEDSSKEVEDSSSSKESDEWT